MTWNDLKWNKNTEYICNKARKKLWILHHLHSLKLTFQQMFDVYTKEVRTVLEFAAPVWHSSLTKKQISEIENIQKLAFRIILGTAYPGYSGACAKFGTNTLEKRRPEICYRFAKKNLNSERNLFLKSSERPGLRRRTNVVREYKCNKARFQRSSLPFLASMLNSRSWTRAIYSSCT